MGTGAGDVGGGISTRIREQQKGEAGLEVFTGEFPERFTNGNEERFGLLHEIAQSFLFGITFREFRLRERDLRVQLIAVVESLTDVSHDSGKLSKIRAGGAGAGVMPGGVASIVAVNAVDLPA